MVLDHSKKCYVESHTYLGKISINTGCVHNIQFSLTYSPANTCPIKCELICNESSFSEINKIRKNIGPVVISSDYSGEGYPRVIARLPIIYSMWRKGYPKHIDNFIFENVAYLEIHNLSIERKLNTKPRELAAYFFLDGPQNVWPISSLGEYSYTGNVRYKNDNYMVSRKKPFPHKIKIFRHYFHGNTIEDANNTRKTISRICVKIYTKDYKVGKNAFIEHCIYLVNKITQIGSFVAGKQINWYRYALSDKNYVIEYYRHCNISNRENVKLEDLNVERHLMKNFMGNALRKYDEIREKNKWYFMPIIYYLLGNQSEIAEHKFMNYYLALEKLLSWYGNKYNVGSIIRDKYDYIEKLIRGVIKNNIKSKERRKEIYKKIGIMHLTNPVSSTILVVGGGLKEEGHEPTKVRRDDRGWGKAVHRERSVAERPGMSALWT